MRRTSHESRIRSWQQRIGITETINDTGEMTMVRNLIQEFVQCAHSFGRTMAKEMVKECDQPGKLSPGLVATGASINFILKYIDLQEYIAFNKQLCVIGTSCIVRRSNGELEANWRVMAWLNPGSGDSPQVLVAK